MLFRRGPGRSEPWFRVWCKVVALRSRRRRGPPRGASPLPHHLPRRLVLPHPEEARVAKAPVGGPLGEADLRHQLRLHPGRATHAGNLVVAREGPRRPLALAHLGADLVQRRAVEPGADLSGVDQLAVAVVAEQERTELLARAARCGEAADHDFLAVLALELQPV